MNKKTLLWATLGLSALAAAIVAAQRQHYPPATHPNPDAPAQTDQTILVDAAPERVWQVLSQINRWPDWQPDIQTAHLHGPVQPGSSFNWKTGGLTIHSTLHTAEPGVALGWSGAALGAFAVHNWTLTPEAGSTRVRVQESMEGWAVRLLTDYFQKGLTTSITKWLTLLKSEAERG